MTTRTRHLIKEEEAVSPVIGVILMVAITVILAAVIGAFVFGMGGSLKNTYSVGVTASQSGANTVELTFQGGPDADLVTKMTINANGSIGSSPYEDPTTGDMWTITNAGNITTGRDHVVVTAEFADGTKQVVLDTYV